MFSMLKVENVVKPPQKPVINNHLNVSSVAFFDKIPIRKPMKKHPKTLIIKVANGKLPDQILETDSETKNRKTLPIAPPIAMRKIVLSIS